MGEHVAAIDLGTTGVRCVVFDRDAQPVGKAYRELSLAYPRPGWVEQDPEAMVAGALSVVRAALRQARIRAVDLAALGITDQRETTVAWDRATGRPVHPAIVWQDRRTAPHCEALRRAGAEEGLRGRTGLPLDPYFSASKISWLLEHIPGLRERAARGEVLFGTVDAWLLWSLCGIHATDVTNASRTLLYDIRALRWDEEALVLFDVPAGCLPEVRPSLSVFGHTRPELLGAAVPVAGVLGDQESALFGQACFAPGEAKVTWGTGAFLLMNVGTRFVPSRHGLLTTVAYADRAEVRYALEGSIFVAGAAVQWLRDGLGLLKDAAESESLAGGLPSNEGVYFVPALTGLGAPHWDPYARGTILGVTRGTGRAHLVRAALEAIAYQTHDVVRAMEADAGVPIRELRVDGGAARNDFLCQFQADVLGIPVLRPRFPETTVLGAALAAGVSVGFWRDLAELRARWEEDRRFVPQMSDADRERLLAGWRAAVARARGWAREAG
ncbi:MAG: glycerol kinase GlpK [Candidatus Acetothermia bacterium]|jgi:glycerol kinase|nr:glycerol kinase GlpK [Candidatus Acetothermia bacterium]